MILCFHPGLPSGARIKSRLVTVPSGPLLTSPAFQPSPAPGPLHLLFPVPGVLFSTSTQVGPCSGQVSAGLSTTSPALSLCLLLSWPSSFYSHLVCLVTGHLSDSSARGCQRSTSRTFVRLVHL